MFDMVPNTPLKCNTKVLYSVLHFENLKLLILKKNSRRLLLLKLTLYLISSVIRQKGESQNGCFKKTKHAKCLEKRTSLTPWYAHVRVRSGGKKSSFFGKFGVLYFLETPVLRVAILPYYRRFINLSLNQWSLI